MPGTPRWDAVIACPELLRCAPGRMTRLRLHPARCGPLSPTWRRTPSLPWPGAPVRPHDVPPPRVWDELTPHEHAVLLDAPGPEPEVRRSARRTHARSLHLDRPGRGRDRPQLVTAVAHDQATVGLVALICQLSDGGVDFSLRGAASIASPPCGRCRRSGNRSPSVGREGTRAHQPHRPHRAVGGVVGYGRGHRRTCRWSHRRSGHSGRVFHRSWVCSRRGSRRRPQLRVRRSRSDQPRVAERTRTAVMPSSTGRCGGRIRFDRIHLGVRAPDEVSTHYVNGACGTAYLPQARTRRVRTGALV